MFPKGNPGDVKEVWEYFRLTKKEDGKMDETFITFVFEDEDHCTPYRARRRRATATWNGSSWTLSPKV